jgi:hypothetical protein
LVEELALRLLAERRTTTCLLALLDESREVRPELLYVGRGGYLHDGIRDKIAGDPDPSSPCSREMFNNESDQHPVSRGQ